MRCMVCKEKEATVHLTQVVEGKMKKVDLCEECAREKGVDDPTGFSLADLLLGLGASQEMAQATSTSGEPTCPTCGFSQADFKKSGRLGCPDCYRTFADGLDSLLKNMHKGTRHEGKIPRRLRQNRDAHAHIESLQKQLTDAVTTEDYETAARLRDDIKALKDGLGQVVPP